MMGPSEGSHTSHAEAVHKVLNRAGYQYIHPEGIEGMCCGVAFDSKGFPNQAKRKTEELKEALIRSQADLQNVRRRAERDVENAHKYAVEKFVKDLLAVLDSMDRALELAETTDGFDASMLEGTQMTHKLLLDIAAKHGVEPINPVGEVFDPQEHQAMSMVESADHEPNTVMAVMQKGYKLEGRVIRAAMVMVTKGASN